MAAHQQHLLIGGSLHPADAGHEADGQVYQLILIFQIQKRVRFLAALLHNA